MHHVPSSPIVNKLCATLLVTVFGSFSGMLQAEAPDPSKVIKNDFWGTLYKNGGETFFCKKKFKSESPLLSVSYIYSSSWIREHLDCGTNRQCKRESQDYRKIISDLHNMVPADSYFEFKHEQSIFGILDKSVPIKECGTREKLHLLEPSDDIKGDIARILIYMHTTYKLPLIGRLSDLILWNQIDPPSEAEIARDAAIKEIQGNGNPFVANPGVVNELQQ